MRKPKLAAEIAKQLHKFHQVEIPGPKEPQLWNEIFKFFRKGTFSLILFDVAESNLVFPSLNILDIALQISPWNKNAFVVYMLLLSIWSYACVSTIFAASTLQFDDCEKQRKYETVSFEEVHNEITKLKVVDLSVISEYWLHISNSSKFTLYCW